ncbi:protein of unknown function [Modestobacter italicus]|uniref:Uncharacterized protein n=1 Tax=Modestobacter italicus (strain DSM 44449 / CECT 9708 / BC 501) TaxID=2732864 RepID=I4F0W4_MODI5|nr:hypothetical protein [Modestobacter marinus]CCH89277.1 protein of unknown function [Modestobacter marinus]
MSRTTDFRRTVFNLLARYECVVGQTTDYIDVSGGNKACRFRLDLLDDYVIVDAGAEGEFVFEVTTDRDIDIAQLQSALVSILEWRDIADLEARGQGRLARYEPYRSL